MTNTVTENLRTHFLAATPAQFAEGAAWYAETRAIAAELAAVHNLPIETVATIIAAFSPRTPWARNVMLATEFLNGNKVGTLTRHIGWAESALEVGFDALKGPKVSAFARNIAGDLDAVTVDVWMIRAAGMTTKRITDKQYNEIAESVVELATEYGIRPAQVQAIIWCSIRGDGK